MTPEDALAIVDIIIKPSYLNTVQELVFHHCWLGQTYQEISKLSGYDPDYVRVIGSKLWQTLSSALGEKVTKHNFRAVLREQMRKPEFADVLKTQTSAQPSTLWVPSKDTSLEPKQNVSTQSSGLSFPGDPLSLNSDRYIDRPMVEEAAYEAIVKPGVLLRIKAPQKMGKTSLMVRILAYAASQQMRTIRLNLCQADDTTLSNLDNFLRWFCSNVAQQLGLDAEPTDCWNEGLGSKVSATIFLQNYVLDSLKTPLVIALDDLDWLFEYKNLARDFLPLLRLWHEESNNVDVWQNLHLIVIHCTEKYPLLDLNHSPFNVGVPIELDELSRQSSFQLASHYEPFIPETLGFDAAFEKMYALVGGHPYLLSLAFYHLAKSGMDLDTLIVNAPTQMGVYKSHLQSHLIAIQQSPELAEALAQIVKVNAPVRLDVLIAHRLHSLGLVRFVGNEVCLQCELYRQYFQSQLNESL